MKFTSAIYWKSSVFFVLLYTVFSCSKSPKPVTKPETNCLEISLSKSSVFPFDSVFVQLNPIESAQNLTVEFWQNDQNTGASMSLERVGDKAFFLAPVNPSDPLSQGTVDAKFVNITDNSSCSSLALEIKSLPEANGYMEEISNLLQTLIEQKIAFLGYDTALLDGDLANLPIALAPFVIPYKLLNNTEGEFSLKSQLSSETNFYDSSIDNKSQIELAGRILQKYGFKEILARDIEEFELNQVRKRPLKPLDFDCVGLDGNEIGRQMRISADAAKYLDPTSEQGKKLAQTSDGALYTGIVPGLGTASAMAGGALFIYKKMYEGIYNSYFNSFTAFDFNISPIKQLEETACDPMPYTEAKVSVSSNDWSVDTSIWESFLQLVGFAASRINWASKLQSVPFDASMAFTSKQIDNLASQGYLNNDKFNIDAKACSNIDITDNKFIYAGVTGDAFSVDQENMRVIPEKAGTSDLEVGPRVLFFGGNTISKTVQLDITPIQLSWDPSTIRVTPGEQTQAQLRIYNALDKDIKVTEEKGATQQNGFVDLGLQYSGAWNYKIFTPSAENQYPYTIVAEHTSKRCLRGKPNAEPRIAVLGIDDGISVEVFSYDFGCLEGGETRQFEANVTGDNKEVTWSAYNETNEAVSISSTGNFKAPLSSGNYLVIATSVADQSAADTLVVEVGSCSCQWSLSGGGILSAGNNANFDRVTIPGRVALSLSDFDDISSLITIYFNDNYLPADGETTEFTLTQDQKDDDPWLFYTLKGNKIIAGPSPEDHKDVPQPAPSSLNVKLSRKGNSLKGQLNGNLVLQSVPPTSEATMTRVQVLFQAAEVDPSKNLFGCENDN